MESIRLGGSAHEIVNKTLPGSGESEGCLGGGRSSGDGGLGNGEV